MVLVFGDSSTSEGQKCPSFGINNNAKDKAVMNKVSVQSLNECFNVSGEDFIWVDDDYEILSPSIQWYQEMNLPNPNKNRVWITNGKDNMMVKCEEIPNGWHKGRTFKFSEDGKKANLKQLKENNPNAKKYKIIFRDGTEQVVKQLSTWARENGHSYTNIKSIVHRTRYKKEKQYECYNSPTYYIKEIVPLEKPSITS